MVHQHTIEKSILMSPLFIAFLWMGFLVVNVQNPEGQLSPARADTLVNVLFVFIILYAVVLAGVFVRMNKKLKEHKPKRKKKKK